MKVDDDTFVNLPKLYHVVTAEDEYKNIKDLLMGHHFGSAPGVFKVRKYVDYFISFGRISVS